MEPYKKRRWRQAANPDPIAFFTCARPGRSGDKTRPVPDKTVHQWVNNLPGPHTTIISLLGRKPPPTSTSEFCFYTFYGREDNLQERRGKRPFQDWLDYYHGERGITLIEHPTIDFQPIPETVLAAIAGEIERLLREGRTIVLVDSGGETRTGTVCRYLSLVEDPRS
jgi:hypothetical protein